ncbi:MAG: hypothetical protein P1Q69_16370 [Candidatus Thorarchaeota archaeon]|nr:hypothetical protein [Candidatus Thorarchaeota archaeon]
MDSQIRLTKVWLSDGSCTSGTLIFNPQPTIILDSGEELDSNIIGIKYDLNYEILVGPKNKPEVVPLDRPLKIVLKPQLVVVRQYSIGEQENNQDIYPPSSNRWVGRFLRGKSDAYYIVQEIYNSEKKLITILDRDAQDILESHVINPYEFGILQLKTSFEYFYNLGRALSTWDLEETRKRILSILDEYLGWSEIYKITGGSVPSDFQRKPTARESLANLIPIDGFPVDSRDEVLAFLAWVAKGKMPEGDIAEFTSNIRQLPMFAHLFGEHLRFVMDQIEPPYYVAMIAELAQEKREGEKKLVDEELSKKLDGILAYKLWTLAPDWKSEIVKITQKLVSSNEIVTSFPVSKSKTLQAQRERYMINQWGLRLRGQAKPRSMGLKQLVYLGAAHRYPHLHLASSLRLGPVDKPSPYLQDLIMPVSAAEKIKRVLPTVIDIKHDIWNLNLNLFSQGQNKWTTRIKSILQSLEKSITIEQFERSFGFGDSTNIYKPTTEEVKVIDMTSLHFYLTDLAREAGRRYWGIDAERAKKILTHLRNRGVIDVSYWFLFREVIRGISIILEGSQGQTCSLTQAFLKYSPSCRVYISEDGNTSIILARVSDDAIEVITRTLPSMAKEVGINMRYGFPTSFRNYSSDLYQRILNDDGTWIDDVSAFLSQVRSTPKSSDSH